MCTDIRLVLISARLCGEPLHGQGDDSVVSVTERGTMLRRFGILWQRVFATSVREVINNLLKTCSVSQGASRCGFLGLHMRLPMQDDVICHPLILALLVGASLAQKSR